MADDIDCLAGITKAEAQRKRKKRAKKKRGKVRKR